MMKKHFNFQKINSFEKEGQIKRIVIMILIYLTVIQQLPIIRSTYYAQFRIVLYILFGLFTLQSVFQVKKYLRYKIVIFYIIMIVYYVFLYMLEILWGHDPNNLIEIMMPLGILLCSMNTTFSESQLNKSLVGYGILVLIMGLTSIFYYGVGFNILKTYSVSGKNQIGTILGISTIIMGVSLFDKEQIKAKQNFKFIKLVLVLLMLSLIIVIRNRGSIIGVLFTFLMYFGVDFKFKKTIKNLVIMQILLVGVFCLFLSGTINHIGTVIWESVTLNVDVRDINSLTSNRVEGYQEAFRYVMKYPFLGGLGTDETLSYIPHNYVLLKWTEYGLLGSLPIILFYVYIWVFVMKGIVKGRMNRGSFTLPLWALLFSMIGSLFEYAFPFGPGTTQIMTWFLLGQYLKSDLLKLPDNNLKE